MYLKEHVCNTGCAQMDYKENGLKKIESFEIRMVYLKRTYLLPI